LLLSVSRFPLRCFQQASQFAGGRTQAGSHAFLKGFHGYLQADAYAGYDQLYATERIVEVGCWAHARRKFCEARDGDPERSQRVLGLIRQLYAVEKQARQQAQVQKLSEAASWERRRQLRQEQAQPLLTCLCQQ
jgi:transposase